MAFLPFDEDAATIAHDRRPAKEHLLGTRAATLPRLSRGAAAAPRDQAAQASTITGLCRTSGACHRGR
jgi:hypothetical protein